MQSCHRSAHIADIDVQRYTHLPACITPAHSHTPVVVQVVSNICTAQAAPLQGTNTLLILQNVTVVVQQAPVAADDNVWLAQSWVAANSAFNPSDPNSVTIIHDGNVSG